jgi:glutaconate CoA-transferase subunit B
MAYNANEMMTIAAARALRNSDICFVGIGMPSAACNLARLTHAPDITLIYESGTIATKLQGGRFSVGFLGGAQIDRFANLNTTVVGPYGKPKTRLPGGGGAPEISSACGEIFIIMRQSTRSFVEKLDFVTSFGHGEGGDHRIRLGLATKGPTKLVTDLAIFEPDPATREMTVTSIHPGVTRDAIKANTGWAVRYAANVTETPAPTDRELSVLREVHARTARAHGDAA